jgi:RND family efflux transporter MFP subunit
MGNTGFPPNSLQEAALPTLTSEAPARAAATAAAHGRPSTAKRSWWAKLLWGLAVCIALGVGWEVASRSVSQPEKETLPSDTGMTQRDPGAVVVTVEPVTWRSVERSIEALGTLYGYEEVAIAAKVDGRVRKIHCDVSDRVKSGCVLVEFDPTDQELLLGQAEKSLRVDLMKLGLDALPKDAKLDVERLPAVVQARERMSNAKVRYDRILTLARTGAASAEEVTDKTTDYRAADAEYRNQILLAHSLMAAAEMKRESLAIARQQLIDMAIKAPVPLQPVPGMEAGVTYVVSQRAVAEGSFVRTGTEVCKLVIDRVLKLKVLVPERYCHEIQLGQRVGVSTAAHAQSCTGLVARINPTVDPVNRTFQVEIAVPNAEGKLRPGSFAKAAILTRQDRDVATVPLEAVTTFAGITKIFVIEDGKAKEVHVALGLQNTEWAEIARPNLPRGARVVVSGQSAIADGTPIAIRHPSGNPKSEYRNSKQVQNPIAE